MYPHTKHNKSWIVIHRYKLVSVLHYATTNNSNQTIMYKLTKTILNGDREIQSTVLIPIITFANTIELEKFISCCKSYVVVENLEYKRICSPSRIKLTLEPVEPIDLSTGINLLAGQYGEELSRYNQRIILHNQVLTKSNRVRHKAPTEGHLDQYSVKKVDDDKRWIRYEYDAGIITIA